VTSSLVTLSDALILPVSQLRTRHKLGHG